MSKLIATVYKEAQHESLPQVALEEQLVAIMESEQIAHDIMENSANTERGVELSAALEDLAFVVDQIREITPKEAALIQIAGDTAVAGTEFKGDEITPAMEAEATSSDIAGTIRRTVEKVIAAIKELLRKSYEHVKSYISRATVVAGGSHRRAEQLRKAYKDLSRGSKLGDNIDMIMPSVDNKVVSNAPDLLAHAKDFNEAVKSFVGDSNNLNFAFGSGFTRLFETGGTDDIKGRLDILKRISTTFTKDHKLRTSAAISSGDMYHTASSSPLLGNIRIQIESVDVTIFDADVEHSSTSLGELIDKTARHNKLFVLQDEHGVGGASMEISPLRPNEIGRALDLVDDLISSYSVRNSNVALKACMEKRVAFADACAKQIAGSLKQISDKAKTAHTYAAHALTVTEAIHRNATTPYVQLSSHTNRVISALLLLISKSIAAHEKANA